MDRPTYRRPAPLDDALAEEIVGDPGPYVTSEVAHTTAQALVDGGRTGSADRELVQRLVTLVETEGLVTVADLWSHAPAVSLPGALWRLYVMREWSRRDPHQVVRAYRAGMANAEVSSAIAGVVEPPGPDDVMTTADQILTGIFAGDLDVALSRAGAFLRVAATGLAELSDDGDHTRLTRAANLLRTSTELERAGQLARSGGLE